MGLLLIVGVLLAGRIVRQRLLCGSDGSWRDPLWLAEFMPDAAAEAAAPTARPVLAAPLDINTCSLDSLTLLPGIGPVLAGRIAAARQEGLRFAAPADLELVKGIGPALAAKITPWVLFLAAPAADSSQTPASDAVAPRKVSQAPNEIDSG